MGEQTDAAEVLKAAIDRRELLRELQASGSTRADIQAALDVSPSTTHRVVKRFESFGVIHSEDGRYELTPYGRVVAAEAENARRAVRVASRLSPLLESFERADEHVELHVLADADVTTPEPGDPYRPMRRLLSLVENATRIREFTPTVPEPSYLRTLCDRVQSGVRAAVLYPASTVDRLRRENEAVLERALADENFELRVGDHPEFQLAVADDYVYLGGYNDDASRLQLVVDTDNPAAVEWATGCFQDRWDAATPCEAYLDGGND